MTTTIAGRTGGFGEALGAPGRSPEIPESADVYGWLIGSWELEVRRYWVDVAGLRRSRARSISRWVLEGRAVQDVWIMPRRAERTGSLDKTLNMYGTTLARVGPVDPGVADHVDQSRHRPARASRSAAGAARTSCRSGTGPTARRSAGCFTEITPDSFRWTGEALEPDGKTWKLEGEFRARRMG